MKTIIRKHPRLFLSFAAILSIFIFVFLHFNHQRLLAYYYINEHSEVWVEPSIDIIAFLSTTILFMLLSLAILMQRHIFRLEREIDERIMLEKQREEIKQALLQSQKLEAVGMLAGGIAHNFNNVLYAIQGYVQMSRLDIDPATITYQNLGKVLEAVERGQELVQGILCFSRREHYHLAPLSLRQVLDSAIQLLQSTLPASTQLSVKIDLADDLVDANRTQLQQVFINIIRNAADSLGENGTITVHAVLEDKPESLKILRPGLPYPAYFVVSIKDNGSGMSEETLRHLFEPFFTTKDVGKGTGLGLATARSIVRDHRGEMIVQSVLNQGSTFIVLLPISAGREEKK